MRLYPLSARYHKPTRSIVLTRPELAVLLGGVYDDYSISPEEEVVCRRCPVSETSGGGGDFCRDVQDLPGSDIMLEFEPLLRTQPLTTVNIALSECMQLNTSVLQARSARSALAPKCLGNAFLVLMALTLRATANARHVSL